METCIYKALDGDSYKKLGHILVNELREGTLAFHPYALAITITTTMDMFNAVKGTIESEKLSFDIEKVSEPTFADMDVIDNPLSSAWTLRGIIKTLLQEQKMNQEGDKEIIGNYHSLCKDLKNAADVDKAQAETYKSYWLDECNKADRVKKRIEAISVLLQSIYPS